MKTLKIVLFSIGLLLSAPQINAFVTDKDLSKDTLLIEYIQEIAQQDHQVIDGKVIVAQLLKHERDPFIHLIVKVNEYIETNNGKEPGIVAILKMAKETGVNILLLKRIKTILDSIKEKTGKDFRKFCTLIVTGYYEYIDEQGDIHDVSFEITDTNTGNKQRTRA